LYVLLSLLLNQYISDQRNLLIVLDT